jgi:hypothetical protein
MATQWYQSINASKRFRLGTKKKDISDNVYIYMKGVASLAAGDFVQYDENFAPTRLLNSSASAGPAAVSMAANTSATNYSWFQIYGNGSALAGGTVAADKQLQATGTAGQVDDTTVAGDTIIGAFSMGADAAGAGSALAVWLNYPYFEAVAIV